VIRVRQRFPRPREEDVARAVRRELARLNLGSRLGPGARVCLTAGSRGIVDIVLILSQAVAYLKELGAEPFLVAAMGGHGGGTVAGQRRVLESLGITEEAVGAKVLIGEEAVPIGETPAGQTVYCDAYAAQADAILVVNRVKMHTSFRGDLESGLFKMMVVGLGKEPGARSFHRLGWRGMASSLVSMGQCFLERMPVVGGLAVLENGYKETAGVYALAPEEMEERERELQAEAKRLLPRLPVHEIDLLVVDEIGKDISGTGMDSNVIGRRRNDGEPDFYPPRIKRIVVLGLSRATAGNGYGIGLADFTTARAVKMLDREATYANALASGFPAKAMIPMTLKDDREAIEAALRSLGGRADGLVRIRNTSRLDVIEMSPDLAPRLRPDVDYEVLGGPYELSFDQEGRLRPLDFAEPGDKP